MNSADVSDLASFHLNLVSTNENVLSKIFNNLNEDEIYNSNKDQYNDLIMQYMVGKLENLNGIIKNNLTDELHEFEITSTSNDDATDYKFHPNLESKNLDAKEISISNIDFNDAYTPFTEKEKEKIIQEIDLNAESRYAKYNNLFNRMKLEFREVLTFPNVNQIDDENENDELKDFNKYLTTKNPPNEKVTNFDSLQIDKQYDHLYFDSYTNTNISMIKENDNDLNATTVINTETAIPIIPQQSEHSNDLKKRLNNLKSASRSNLLKKNQNTKNTTGDKFNVVKKLGNAKANKKKSAFNKDTSAKQNQEQETLNNKLDSSINNIRINPNNISNSLTENIPHQKTNKLAPSEKRKKRVSNGATIGIAPKEHMEQVNPRKRFYTHTKPKSKINSKDLSKKEGNNVNKTKSNSIIDNNAKIMPLNSQNINNIQKYNTNDNYNENNIIETNDKENNFNTCDDIIKSTTSINNIQAVNSQITGTSQSKKKTLLPDHQDTKNEEPIEEFKIELKPEKKEKAIQSQLPEIKNKFKNIVMNENFSSDDHQILKGNKCPDKLNLTKNLKINTIESVTYLDISDDDILDPLNYYTVNEESVLQKFPVLSMNTNHMTNDSLMGRNRKVKNDKILIHAGSGKRIKPEVRLETLENKENLDEVVRILY